MKARTHLLIALMLFAGIADKANATTRTVNNANNLPVNPGQYMDIPAAITASSPGDTIIVAGSTTNYGNTAINVNKQLVFIGPGYNPDKQNPLKATVSTNFNLNATNASGTVIEGFDNITVAFSPGAVISNVWIRRNRINNVYLYDSTNNITISENVFIGFGIILNSSKSHLGLLITNNVFVAATPLNFPTSLPTNYNPITFSHNLFIGGNLNQPLISSGWTKLGSISTRNAVIKDNIFYNTDGSVANTTSNATYNNNLTFAGASLPTLPPTGAIGSGNINNSNPLFISIFNTVNTVDYNLDNLRLSSTSPARNAATDGTDIGPTGGPYPIYLNTNAYLTGEPPVPEVKTITYISNSAVSPGTPLQIQVKAKKIN